MKPPLVKLCGLRTRADVEAALDARADALGFVLCASPRRVTRDEAAQLLEFVPAHVLRVAVMGPPTALLLALANALPFDAVQCELDEVSTPALTSRRFLIPSFRDGADVQRNVSRYLASAPERRSRSPFEGAFVLDGPNGGGRAIAPNGARAARLAETGRLILAGGLTPETVESSTRTLRPFAVDVSSGIERARGQKDPQLMQRFARCARGEETL